MQTCRSDPANQQARYNTVIVLLIPWTIAQVATAFRILTQAVEVKTWTMACETYDWDKKRICSIYPGGG